MRTALALASLIVLAACGGGDEGEPSSYTLSMTTIDGKTEVIGTYSTSNDCVGAGSYRVASQPAKYTGYACKGD